MFRRKNKSRRSSTSFKNWEPTISNPFRGFIVWSNPDPIEITTTLYRDSHSPNFDTKHWTLLVENITNTGRRTKVAFCNLDLSKYAEAELTVPAVKEIDKIVLNPASKKVKDAYLSFNLTCQFLKQGNATYVYKLLFVILMKPCGFHLKYFFLFVCTITVMMICKVLPAFLIQKLQRMKMMWAI